MWNNNRTVNQTYASSNTQNAWVLINGIPGWKKIRTHSTDGVTNCFSMLNAAKANGKIVDVYIVSNQVERVVLR